MSESDAFQNTRSLRVENWLLSSYSAFDGVVEWIRSSLCSMSACVCVCLLCCVCCSNPNKEPIVTEAVSLCNICSVLHLFVCLSFVRLWFELVSFLQSWNRDLLALGGNRRRARVNSSVFYCTGAEKQKNKKIKLKNGEKLFDLCVVFLNIEPLGRSL